MTAQRGRRHRLVDGNARSYDRNPILGSAASSFITVSAFI